MLCSLWVALYKGCPEIMRLLRPEIMRPQNRLPGNYATFAPGNYATSKPSPWELRVFRAPAPPLRTLPAHLNYPLPEGAQKKKEGAYCACFCIWDISRRLVAQRRHINYMATSQVTASSPTHLAPNRKVRNFAKARISHAGVTLGFLFGAIAKSKFALIAIVTGRS